MKVTACAHPVQELIIPLAHLTGGYHLPFCDSISVSTAPLSTIATVQFQEERDILINGVPPDPHTALRIDAVMRQIKRVSGIQEEIKIYSQDNFSEKCGLDSLSPLIAAVTVAAAGAGGLDLSWKELSSIAGRGTPSAPGAVTGYFSRWSAQLQENSSYSSVLNDNLDMGMLGITIPPPSKDKNSQDIIPPPSPSHLLEFRMKMIQVSLSEMEQAIRTHKISTIGLCAERESIMTHAVTMGEDTTLIPWNSHALRIMTEVYALREEGICAWFNMNPGPSLFINCPPHDVPSIEKRIRELHIPVIPLQVGRGAHLLSEHLF